MKWRGVKEGGGRGVSGGGAAVQKKAECVNVPGR